MLFSYLVLLATSLQAQTGFNYKAQVANNGSIATNQGLTVQFTVYNGNPTAGGVQVYQETQATTTDANGLISLILGTGTSSDNWNSITWSLKNQHLKTEFDLGSGYVDMGTQMFSSVPYAKYADYAGNAFSRLYDDLIGKPANFNLAGSVDYPTSINDNVYRQGRLALGFNNPTEGLLDLRQSGTGTTNADVTGLYVKNSNTSTSTLYGVKCKLPSDANGDQIAYSSDIIGIGNGNHYGMFNNLFGTGEGDHYGVYNLFLGAGTGVQYGMYTNNQNSGNENHFGNYVALSGGGSGAHYGDYLILSGAGTGSQIGVNVGVSNSGNATHYGLKNNLSGTGSGAHYGVDNTLTGAGTGIQYAIRNVIDNSNTNTHYGVYNALSGIGSGTHYGNFNLLSGDGTGDQFGLRSSISNTGNGVHYALYAALSGSGSNTHLGLYNTLSGSGSGNQYGVKTEISNTSNGSHYGSYTLITGNGSGTKYGSFNKIESTAGGTHYAVYGNATKAGSYAGYFEGDVKVSENAQIEGEINSTATGTADLKPKMFGRVNSGGNVVLAASTNNFTVTKTSTIGTYTITFDTPFANSQAYMVVANAAGGLSDALSVVIDYSSNTYFKVMLANHNGNHEYADFSFIVYGQ